MHKRSGYAAGGRADEAVCALFGKSDQAASRNVVVEPSALEKRMEARVQ